MDGAFEAILPASILSASSFTAPTRNVIRWAWQDGKCFAFEGMEKIARSYWDGFDLGQTSYCQKSNLLYVSKPVKSSC